LQSNGIRGDIAAYPAKAKQLEGGERYQKPTKGEFMKFKSEQKAGRRGKERSHKGREWLDRPKKRRVPLSKPRTSWKTASSRCYGLTRRNNRGQVQLGGGAGGSHISSR